MVRKWADGVVLAFALVALLFPPAFADSLAPVVPDTPAGRVLGSWLDVFNSGDRARIEAFNEAHMKWWALDNSMALRAKTGGYDLVRITGSGRYWITFGAKEKTTGSQFTGILVVRSADPARISVLAFDPSGPKTIDEPERRRVLESAAKLLDEFYVFPDVGHKMALSLRSAEQRGEYRDITDARVFKARLTDDLVAISHDWHLRVMYTPAGSPAGPSEAGNGGPRPQGPDCAFDKVERYPNNVGYVKFDAFMDSDACTEMAVQAMRFLAHVDAIIFDLRDNHGGGGDVGAVLSSYLFTQPTHLEDVYDRTTGKTSQSWTSPYVPGDRLGDIPVYVLTSGGTFSAGENFAYELQAAKRATVVGEVTGGGANIGQPHRIDEQFVIWIPNARPVNPYTGTNWDGNGVIPDVKVPASDALDVARKLASQAIKKRSGGGPR
jgi:Peptidase family S41/N-terminal domain of Peptidase_S41 in eukaryotic IRBP